MNLLKRLTYSPPIRRVARALHLQHIARKWYCRWAWPRDGILQLVINGISGQFYVRKPEDLRELESEILKEQQVLGALIPTLHRGDIVYDIGAHVGLYTVLLAKAVDEEGQVIAFEPMSENSDRLQDNLKLNAVTNVRSFRKALGDRTGEGKLYSGWEPGPSASPSLMRPATGVKDKQVVEIVEVVEGDQFVEAQRLPLPWAVKIDVEGCEYAVIRGLQQTLAQPACQLVCCEIHPQFLPAEVKPEAVLNLIKSLGFNRIDLYPGQGRVEYHAVCYKSER